MVSDLGMPRLYRSIFWDDDWAHQKHYGWQVVQDEFALRTLNKTKFGLNRSLLLLSSGGQPNIEQAIARLRHPFSEIIIHDFHKVLTDEILGSGWQVVPDSERLLNVATYVIDLTLPLERLWENLGAKSRNAVRKAEDQKLNFRIESNFNALEEAFYTIYCAMAQRIGLQIPSPSVLKSMYLADQLLCGICMEPSGKPIIANLIYKTNKKAFYMYGANSSPLTTGAGQFAQWKLIEHLKQFGLDWYDLGGVVGTPTNNGIHRFKKSMGGQYFDLGCEYRSRSLPYELIKELKSSMEKLIGEKICQVLKSP